MSCAEERWNPQHLVAGSEIAFIRRGGGLSRNHDDEFEDRRTCIDGNSEPTRVSESQDFWRMELGRGCFWRRATPAVHRVGLRGQMAWKIPTNLRFWILPASIFPESNCLKEGCRSGLRHIQTIRRNLQTQLGPGTSFVQWLPPSIPSLPCPTKVPPPGLPRWFPRLCATRGQHGWRYS